MLHCIGKVLDRKDKFHLSIYIDTRNFHKERNKCTILYIVISYTLNNVVY
jgi:hypothetical protein